MRRGGEHETIDILAQLTHPVKPLFGIFAPLMLRTRIVTCDRNDAQADLRCADRARPFILYAESDKGQGLRAEILRPRS